MAFLFAGVTTVKTAVENVADLLRVSQEQLSATREGSGLEASTYSPTAPAGSSCPYRRRRRPQAWPRQLGSGAISEAVALAIPVGAKRTSSYSASFCT